MFTDYSAAECRSKAEASLTRADRGGAGREQMLVDAAGWMLLADHLDFIAIAATAAWRLRQH
jgi:hypothetical protein